MKLDYEGLGGVFATRTSYPVAGVTVPDNRPAVAGDDGYLVTDLDKRNAVWLPKEVFEAGYYKVFPASLIVKKEKAKSLYVPKLIGSMTKLLKRLAALKQRAEPIGTDTTPSRAEEIRQELERLAIVEAHARQELVRQLTPVFQGSYDTFTQVSRDGLHHVRINEMWEYDYAQYVGDIAIPQEDRKGFLIWYAPGRYRWVDAKRIDQEYPVRLNYQDYLSQSYDVRTLLWLKGDLSFWAGVVRRDGCLFHEGRGDPDTFKYQDSVYNDLVGASTGVLWLLDLLAKKGAKMTTLNDLNPLQDCYCVFATPVPYSDKITDSMLNLNALPRQTPDPGSLGYLVNTVTLGDNALTFLPGDGKDYWLSAFDFKQDFVKVFPAGLDVSGDKDSLYCRRDPDCILLVLSRLRALLQLSDAPTNQVGFFKKHTGQTEAGISHLTSVFRGLVAPVFKGTLAYADALVGNYGGRIAKLHHMTEGTYLRYTGLDGGDYAIENSRKGYLVIFDSGDKTWWSADQLAQNCKTTFNLAYYVKLTPDFQDLLWKEAELKERVRVEVELQDKREATGLLHDCYWRRRYIRGLRETLDAVGNLIILNNPAS